ncbi:BrnA antitoxin family protein [Novosphingobium sp.]|uniref:BrnA antitoxin family protein n=1 Tax=Novosphingobium sp. TaxID=1874826 RepID=UPI00333ED1EC
MNDQRPVVFDDDNPEWTRDDFARARPADAVHGAAIAQALLRKPGRPIGSTKTNAKKSISLRLDPDVIERWRATGPGWQARMNDALRLALR